MKTVAGALCPLPPIQFVCDEMLRGLAEWLRVAGYDTLVPESGTMDRNVLDMAVTDGRWLITRDRDLTNHGRAPAYVILLQSHGMDPNIQELTELLDLDWLHAPFSRCKRCNTLLERSQRKAGPMHPAEQGSTVYYCPSCQQEFWEGSHVRHMQERLEDFNRYRRKT